MEQRRSVAGVAARLVRSLRVRVVPTIFILLAAFQLALGAQPLEKQSAPMVGWLALGTESTDTRARAVFWEALRQLGWTERRNLAVHYRYADGKADRLIALAQELVSLRVHLIITSGTPAVRAAKTVTTAIPIVMMTSSDPVTDGLVSSLNRPGGNVTGLTLLAPELGGKRLQMLTQAIAQAGGVAVLVNPDNPTHPARMKELQLAAQNLNRHVRAVNARQRNEYRAAFETARGDRAAGLITLSDAMFWYDRKEIVALAGESRLPALYPERDFVDAGGLMAHGPVIAENWRRAAWYVDRILKGTRPSELPVEEPTKFEFVINLKTAKSLGLAIPPSLLLRADQVIE